MLAWNTVSITHRISSKDTYEKVIKGAFQAVTENINICWKKVGRRSHFSPDTVDSFITRYANITGPIHLDYDTQVETGELEESYFKDVSGQLILSPLLKTMPYHLANV